MTKVEELEKAVLMLEEQVATNKEMSETYLKDLELAKKQLADVNKPVMTNEMFDNITELVEEGIGNFDFSDADNYDIEFGIDYDGKVEAAGLEFNSASELTEKIMNKVDSHYKISTSEDIK